MESQILIPQVTAEIPVPAPAFRAEGDLGLPRVLAERIDEARLRRRMRIVLVILAALSAAQAAILPRLEESLHLVLYKEVAQKALVER